MTTVLTANEWLTLNTKYCNRYHARMTQEGCEENRQKTDNCRCVGCAGLEDIERELEYRQPVVIQCEPEADDLMTRAFAGALQDILNGKEDEETLEDPEAEDLDDESEKVKDFHHKLLALMDYEPEEPEQERRPRPKKMSIRRVAVYMGRCPRCSGYMTNVSEKQFNERDDETYRCFSCGWRTSPAYEWNRHQYFLNKGEYL